MALSRCTYHAEVLSAVFRRPALKIPAFGFGFRGVGDSYRTTAAVPLRNFRSDDSVTIRRGREVDDGELDWNRTDGLLRSAADELLVSLRAGDWVAYDFVVSSPSRLQILVTLEAAGASVFQGRALDISIDGAAQGVEVPDDSSVTTTTEELGAGRHVVQLTGRWSETLVRSIEVTPTKAS
jgi:hypothetical protein